MDETQFGGPNPQEPTGRKPDGRSLLNRLSPDRQAAVADYAATHTLPETVEWLNDDSQRSKLKLGLEVVAEPFRARPEALKLCEHACEIVDPGCPPEEATQSTNPGQDPAREPKSPKNQG